MTEAIEEAKGLVLEKRHGQEIGPKGLFSSILKEYTSKLLETVSDEDRKRLEKGLSALHEIEDHIRLLDLIVQSKFFEPQIIGIGLGSIPIWVATELKNKTELIKCYSQILEKNNFHEVLKEINPQSEAVSMIAGGELRKRVEMEIGFLFGQEILRLSCGKLSWGYSHGDKLLSKMAGAANPNFRSQLRLLVRD